MTATDEHHSLGWRLSTTNSYPQIPVVKEVQPGGWADLQGVELGDEIVELNGGSVRNCSQAELMGENQSEGGFAVGDAVEIVRGALRSHQRCALPAGLALNAS